MTTAILVILALTFTITSQIFKKGFLAFAGAGAWMIAAIQSFSMSLATWDVYFSLGFLFIGLVLVCIFSPLAWRETTIQGETTEDPDVAAMREEMEALSRDGNQYNFLYKKRSRRKRTRW